MQDLSSRNKYMIFLLNSCTDADFLPQNKRLKNFFFRDLSEPQKSGLTHTFYEHMQIPEIVLRLMDNRDFNKQSNETRKEMIYSDYYPEDAKLVHAIYLDDRRNLCQELHNKVCKELHIEPTVIRIVNFKEDTNYDYDLFHFYDTKDGILYINSMINYEECEQTELAEHVLRGTFVHEVYYKLRKNFVRMDQITGHERYLMISALMKEFVVDSLAEEQCNKLMDEFRFDDVYSSTQVYGILKSYNFLDDIFKKFNLLNIPSAKTLVDTRIDFLNALIGKEDEEDDEDDFEDDVEVEYDEEGNAVEVSADMEDDESIMDDVLEFDFDLLYAVENTLLNKQTHGMFAEFFFEELKSCANDYYGVFELEFDDSTFEEEYKMHRENCKEVEELDAEIDAAIEDDAQNE